MLSIRKNLRRREEGFSLVELLVVILILGVLAAIAIGLYNDSKRLAIRAGVYQDVKHTEIEVATWLAQNKPILGDNSNGGQRISVSKLGNGPAVDNTAGDYLPVASQLNIPISDPRTSITISIDGGLSIPSAGPYDVTFIVRNSNVGGLLSYHTGQAGRVSGQGLLLEGWK